MDLQIITVSESSGAISWKRPVPDRIATGNMLVLQIFLCKLMTSIGSDAVDSASGGDAQKLLGSNAGGTILEIKTDLLIKMGRIVEEMHAEQLNQELPANEMLEDAELISVTYLDDIDKISITFRLEMVERDVGTSIYGLIV